MRRAFTLIELLVVIAIIAILAAILFPVFAQAKLAAKKTTAISNAKQITLSTIMYAGDSDDLFPFAVPPNVAAGTWSRGGSLIDVPADWRPGITGSGYTDRALVFANSTQPYQKNYDLFSVDSAIENFFGSTEAGELKKPTYNSFVMNGLLQFYSSTAVSDVSTCPLYWQGLGNVKMKGFTLANPQLVCAGALTTPCSFGTVATTQYVLDSVTKAYTFQKSVIIGRVDGSAKAKKIAAVEDGVTTLNSAPNYADDPWNVYYVGGAPKGIISCAKAGETIFSSCYFRPDQDGRKP